MSFSVFSKNGKVLPIEEAVVSLFSVEYAYGFGVYETIRVGNRKARFIDDHAERLIKSAEIIGLEHSFSLVKIKNSVLNLAKEIKKNTYNMKIMLIGAPNPENASLYILCSNPLFPDKKLYKNGVKLMTVSYERAYPQAKTLNMLESYIAYKKAIEKNCYDALLLNRHGCITEGTRTNFFAIKGKVIYSPKESGILLGVTRKNILNVAQRKGFKIKERDIRSKDLGQYDGAFITSTSTKIVPIWKINDIELEIPDSVRGLIKYFNDFMKETEELSESARGEGRFGSTGRK